MAAVVIPLGIEVGFFGPPRPVTGRVGVTAVLEGVVLAWVLLLRAEVLDDVIPVALGFVRRDGLDFVIWSALLAIGIAKKNERRK